MAGMSFGEAMEARLGLAKRRQNTSELDSTNRGALMKSQASLYGSQAVGNQLENSGYAQGMQLAGYSTDEFLGQRYADGGEVNLAQRLGRAARTGAESVNALAKQLGNYAENTTIPAGRIAALTANVGSQVGSDVRSGYTGEKYVPNQYKALPLKEIFGGQPAGRSTGGASGTWGEAQQRPATAIQPQTKAAAAVEKPAPRADPRESGKSNADWNAWVAYHNKPQPPSMEDQLRAMAGRPDKFSQQGAAGLVGAMGALTQRDKANQEAAHQALYGPAQIRQADAQARYYDSQGTAQKFGATTEAAKAGIAGKAKHYKALVDQLATMSSGDPKKDAANPTYKQYMARVQALDAELAQMSDFAFAVPQDGYAEGGMIGAIGATPQQDPMTARYGQYVHAAMQAGVQPLPVEKFVQLLAATQAKMQQAPAGAQPGQPQGYAAGGAIEVEGQQVLGPGTGKSDSIPAIIDGKRPAALSTGEFVMPVEAVQHFGLDRLTKMVAAARKGQQANA